VNSRRQRFAAIVNPVAGRRTMVPRVRRIQKLVELRGGRLDVLLTRGQGDARSLASALPTVVEALLVAGGDGTVSEVINGLGARPLPLLLFRAGTENLAARELGMPTDPDRVVGSLFEDEACPCDLGEVNGKRFLSVAGIGFDAECVVRMNRVRRGHITYLDYFWPIWRAFWSHRFPELHVEADGVVIFDGPGFALISNIARYSVGMRLLPRARVDDGLLDLGVFPCSTRRRLLHYAAMAMTGGSEDRRGMIYQQCRSAKITAAVEVPIELDGELGGVLPVNCVVLPGAAQLLGLPSSPGQRPLTSR